MKPLTCLAAAAGCAAVLAGCSPAGPHAAALRSPVVVTAPAVPVPRVPLVGVYEPGSPGYSQITQFTRATGVRPGVVLYYSGWGEPFQAEFAATAWKRGAYAFVQLEPDTTTLTRVARGYSDPYLKRYASQVRDFGHPVLLSFAHEMNGRWYSWGAGHATAAEFIAAWRHVVQVFRDQGAGNVTWVWTVNAINAASSPLRQWWPGSQWVTWAGIDGYFYRPGDTFASVFGRTLAEIRTFTPAPAFIGETAVGPGPEAASQVTGLFTGARTGHYAGFVWFDKAQHDPPYHQDWHLADDPAALTAFRAAAQNYRQ